MADSIPCLTLPDNDYLLLYGKGLCLYNLNLSHLSIFVSRVTKKYSNEDGCVDYRNYISYKLAAYTSGELLREINKIKLPIHAKEWREAIEEFSRITETRNTIVHCSRNPNADDCNLFCSIPWTNLRNKQWSDKLIDITTLYLENFISANEKFADTLNTLEEHVYSDLDKSDITGHKE